MYFCYFYNVGFRILYKFRNGVFLLKKKLDFLPNKLNKYSIRRFTVGTASISRIYSIIWYWE
ncbi:hypothetical protein B7469_12030 [Staphylococcus lugdunensis]|nr:hypothetical protein B7469_12030 [Staphylococcus lugdunensis]